MQFTREELNLIEQKALQGMYPDMPGDLYEAHKQLALAASSLDAMIYRYFSESGEAQSPKTTPAPQVIKIEVTHTHVFKQNNKS